MIPLAVVVFGLLSVAAVLCLVRLGRGPSMLDRVVATDSLLALVVTGLAASLFFGADSTVLTALVVVSLLGFVGSVSVARYVGGMLTEADPEPEPGAESRDEAKPAGPSEEQR